MATILIIEDDHAVREALTDALTFAGHDTITAADGRTGCETALHATYQVLLLDLVLPFRSGFEILADLRRSRPGQPVIILSARGEEHDRIRGLDMGADDYIVKPFSVRELLSRIDAVLRRTTERPAVTQIWTFPSGSVDLAAGTISFSNNTSKELSDRERELLRFLVSQGNRTVSRTEILTHVWHLDPKNLETRTIDVHIAHLRGKLGDTQQTLLQTVRGRGYRLANQEP